MDIVDGANYFLSLRPNEKLGSVISNLSTDSVDVPKGSFGS